IADAIDDSDVNAVGDGVGALNGSPSIKLSHAELFFFAGMPADTRGIENHLSALESGQARTFGIPLIPTNLNADASISGIEIGEAEIAGREIKLFVVERIVGDVHLAVFAEERAVGIEDGASVVINASGPAFEEGNDQDDFQFFRNLRERVGGGAGDGFREIEKIGVFGAAKIFAAKEFIHADDLRAARRGI